jgi:hypothetical protein
MRSSYRDMNIINSYRRAKQGRIKDFMQRRVQLQVMIDVMSPKIFAEELKHFRKKAIVERNRQNMGIDSCPRIVRTLRNLEIKNLCRPRAGGGGSLWIRACKGTLRSPSSCLELRAGLFITALLSTILALKFILALSQWNQDKSTPS